MGELITPRNRKHDIWMIFTDLDRTLGDRVITDQSAQTIWGFICSKKTRNVVVASGRSTYSIKKALKNAGLEKLIGERLHVSGFNGALSEFRNRYIINKSIPTSIAVDILVRCSDQDLTAIFYSQDEPHITKEDEWSEYFTRMTGYEFKTNPDPERNKYYQIELLKPPEEEEYDFMQRTGVYYYGVTGKVNVFHFGDPPFREQPPYPTNCLQIVPSGVNKAEATLKYMEIIRLYPNEVLTIGDDSNDKEMISMPGVMGVAMGDSREEIKKAARFVTKTVEEEGFTYAVENLVEP